MPKSHKAYPAEFRQRLVDQVRAGRTPEELAEKFEPTAQSIRNWVAHLDPRSLRARSAANRCWFRQLCQFIASTDRRSRSRRRCCHARARRGIARERVAGRAAREPEVARTAHLRSEPATAGRVGVLEVLLARGRRPERLRLRAVRHVVPAAENVVAAEGIG